MKRKIKVLGVLVFFFLILILLVIPSTAQEWKSIEWSFSPELGINRNLRLTGPSPSAILFFPLMTGIEWDQSNLLLEVWFSETLDPSSSLNVFMNDELFFSQTLDTLPIRPGQPGSVRIPLGMFSPSPDDRMAKIEIRPSLFISRNLCEDLASGNLWMEVMKESRIQFNGPLQDIPVSIDEFLLFPASVLEIVLPSGEWPQDIVPGYLTLMVFLGRFYADQPIDIRTVLYDDMSLEQREDQLTRRIYLRSPSMRDYHLLGNRLYLTPAGAESLASSSRAAMTGRSGTVQQDQADPSTYLPRLTFKDLGVDNLHFRGIGDLEARVYFSASDLGGIPNSLRLHLFENLVKPSSTIGGDGFMKIWFNDQLILTGKIPDTPSGPLTRRIVELPVHLVQRENTLKFIYSYIPNEGRCQLGAAPLEVFLADDSFLEYQGTLPLPELLTFQDIPTAFWGKGHVVLPDEPSPQDIAIAAQLVSSIRAMDSTPLLLEVTDIVESMEHLYTKNEGWLSNFAHLPTIERSHVTLIWEELVRIPARIREQTAGAGFGLSGWQTGFTTVLGEYVHGLLRIIRYPVDLLFPQPSPVPIPQYFLYVRPDLGFFPRGLPVLPDNGSMTLGMEPDSGHVVTVTPDEPLAVLMVTSISAKPVLILTTLGRAELALEYFMRHFHGLDTLRRFNGNVVLFGPEGWRDLMVGEPAPRQQALVPTWFDWFQKTQVPILIALFVLLLVFFLHLYFRLARTGKR